MGTISDAMFEFSPRDFLQNLVSGEYYEVLFPFLLIYAVFYTVLSSEKIKLFRNNSVLNKAAVFIVSFSVSLFSVYFELPSGMTIGKLLSLLFPNISTITIVSLCLYVVGMLLGHNFFHDLFTKKYSAYGHIAIGALGLGSVVFYVGLGFGVWSYDPYDFQAIYNVTLAIAMVIMIVVFLIFRMLSYAFIFFVVLGVFLGDGGDKFILSYFVDPVVFMVCIIVFLIGWMGTFKDKKEQLKWDLQEQEKTISEYDERNGGSLTEHQSRLYNISKQGFEANKERWEKEYSGESWQK